MNRSLQVGVTGGIGSGKSVVCEVFRSLGVAVYDADDRARTLVNTDPALMEQLRSEFGADAYLADGSLDRAFVARAVFGNENRLKKLNALVHPAVKRDYSSWNKEHARDPYVIREAALLFEAGVSESLDKVIVVSAPTELRIKRVLARDPQRSIGEIENIIRSQLPEEEKIRRADYVIVNDDMTPILPRILELHRQFEAGS